MSPCADRGADPLGDGDQQPVPDAVAEAVVDVLEVVEVEEQHGERLGGAVAAAQRVGEPVAEQLAVGEPGERVVERLVAELLLERLAVGDVADGEHPALHGRVGHQVGERALEHQVAAVRVPGAQDDRLVALAGGGEHPDEHRYVAGEQLVDEARADELLGVAARARPRTRG